MALLNRFTKEMIVAESAVVALWPEMFGGTGDWDRMLAVGKVLIASVLSKLEIDGVLRACIAVL